MSQRSGGCISVAVTVTVGPLWGRWQLYEQRVYQCQRTLVSKSQEINVT